jgi:hypothetical protein
MTTHPPTDDADDDDWFDICQALADLTGVPVRCRASFSIPTIMSARARYGLN